MKILEIIILIPKLNSIKLQEIMKAMKIKETCINNMILSLIASILFNIMPSKCINKYEKIKNAGKNNIKVKSVNSGNSLFV